MASSMVKSICCPNHEENIDEYQHACAICLESLKNTYLLPIVTYPCTHQYHAQCVKTLRSFGGVNHRCPLCRATLPQPSILYREGCGRFIKLLKDETLTQGAWVATNEIQKKEMESIVKLWICAAEEGEVRSQFILGRIYSYGTGVVADLYESIKWYELAGKQGSHDAYFSIGNVFYEGCAATPKIFDQAIKWFTKAASLGSDKAMKCLGNIHFNGEGVPLDYAIAYEWYLKGVEKGNAQAQFKIANMYFKGHYVNVDFKEAFKWYEKAGAQNIPQALFMMGSMYFSGRGVDQDYTKATVCFEKAASQGYHIAQFKLGNMYYYAHGAALDYDKAYEYYKLASEKNYGNAQLMLGIMYYFGQGTAKNYQEAAMWYKKAIEQNNIIAQLKLGSMHYQGRGMKKDYDKAIYYYDQALKVNNPDAQLLVANMYYKGKGFKKDVKQAVLLYEQSAKQDNLAAQNMLGNIYLSGEGEIEQSYEKAHDWFLKAATLGHVQATLSLANIYFQGQYMGKKLKEAEEWYTVAAGKKNVFAQLSLGNIRMDEKDYFKAFEWYTLAAKQNNLEAQFKLGYLYFNGFGMICSNLDKAKEMLEKAAYRGHVKACILLGDLLFNCGELKNTVKWYHRASMSGDIEAQIKLGQLFQYGYGVETNIEEANKWYAMAVGGTNIDAIERLCCEYSLPSKKVIEKEEAAVTAPSSNRSVMKRSIDNELFGKMEILKNKRMKTH